MARVTQAQAQGVGLTFVRPRTVSETLFAKIGRKQATGQWARIHSALMLAALMIGHHFSISALW
jgi:hypothetical protein